MDTFDYIVVGAGMAGSVVARRLIDRGNASVCVVEAGPRPKGLWVRMPAGFIKLISDPAYTWRFATEPSDNVNGRSIPVPYGRALGGSSVINGMNYNRGQPEDYDDWARHGNHGWSYENLLQYFNKSERRESSAATAARRGMDGPLTISDCGWRHPLCDAFIEGAGEFGIPKNPDYNSGVQPGVGYFQRWIAGERRMTTADAFLTPIDRKQQLDVRTNAQVTQICFDEQKRAKGIKYAQARNSPEVEIRASREVVLCGGAGNSPKLLQLSGVGPAELLGRFGLSPVHALAGVGENLRDHYHVRCAARVRDVVTINQLTRGPRLWLEALKWAFGAPSALGISPSVVFGFWYSRDGLPRPDLQLNFTPASLVGSVPGLLDTFPGMTLGTFQMRPKSSGHVRIRSKDPFDYPVIQPNYLADPDDCAVTVDGIKLTRRLFGSAKLAPFHPIEISPGPDVVTDDELLSYAREKGSTSYHLTGTCKMGPEDDKFAVVDDQLRVRGVSGLRVADAAIMPNIPSANTGASSLMVGEKAADLIGRSSN